VNRSFAYVIHLALTCAAVALLWAARRHPAYARRLWPVLAVVSGIAVLSFAVWDWGRATPFGDFNKAYYPAGRLVFTDPARLYDCGGDPGNLCFVNIPIVAALFTPLAALTADAARAVFTVLGFATVAATVWLLIRITGASGWRRHAIVAIVCLNGPLLYSARLGNISHLLLFPLVLALSRLAAGREAAAGATLAAVALIKPPLFLFLPYFLVRRRWPALAVMGMTTAAVCAVSILWLGIDLHRTWLRDYVIEFGARPIAAYNVQSISGALARFVAPDHSVDWRPLEVSRLFTAMRYLLTFACLGGAIAVCAARGAPRSPAARWTELLRGALSRLAGQPDFVDALLLRARDPAGLVRGAGPRRSAAHAVDGSHVPRRPAHLAPGGTSAPRQPAAGRADYARAALALCVRRHCDAGDPAGGAGDGRSSRRQSAEDPRLTIRPPVRYACCTSIPIVNEPSARSPLCRRSGRCVH
jgi:hypothetical protein